MFVSKGNRDIGRRYLGIRFFTNHLDIAAKGNGRNAIIGSSDFLSDQAGTKPQGKFFNPDAEQSGNQKMSKFMKKNEDS